MQNLINGRNDICGMHTFHDLKIYLIFFSPNNGIKWIIQKKDFMSLCIYKYLAEITLF